MSVFLGAPVVYRVTGINMKVTGVSPCGIGDFGGTLFIATFVAARRTAHVGEVGGAHFSIGTSAGGTYDDVIPSTQIPFTNVLWTGTPFGHPVIDSTHDDLWVNVTIAGSGGTSLVAEFFIEGYFLRH